MILEGTCLAVGTVSAAASAITVLGVLRDWQKQKHLILPQEQKTYWDYDDARRQDLPVHRLEAGQRIRLEIPWGSTTFLCDAYVGNIKMDHHIDPIPYATRRDGTPIYLQGLKSLTVDVGYVATGEVTKATLPLIESADR